MKFHAFIIPVNSNVENSFSPNINTVDDSFPIFFGRTFKYLQILCSISVKMWITANNGGAI